MCVCVCVSQLELREEQNRYQQYLADQLEEQKRQEVETEQLIEAELKQTWARRAEQCHKEKQARDRLMKDVMDTRRLQIQEKCKKAEEREADLSFGQVLCDSAVDLQYTMTCLYHKSSFKWDVVSWCVCLCICASSLVDLNKQKQAQLTEERDELNKTIQENKLLDEREKTRSA